MRVLVACEFSGRVRDAFKAQGHDAWSCDFLPTELPGKHIRRDVLTVLDWGWDLMIAHPPCTYLAISGARWFREPGRYEKQLEALEFVRLLLGAPIRRIALENPVGVISTQVRRPDQIIHPWQFGEEASKATCLWLQNLPLLTSDTIVGRGSFHVTRGGKRIPVHYNLPGNKNRGRLRSRTFLGIARAMAIQWGSLEVVNGYDS